MLYLLVTVIADVIGVALLGKAKGFENPLMLCFGIICMVIGFIAFSFATRTMQVGFANAAWSGLSIVLVLLIGRLFFSESMNAIQYLFMAMIMVGIVGIELADKA